MQSLGPVFEPFLKGGFNLKLFQSMDRDNSFTDKFIKLTNLLNSSRKRDNLL